MNNKINSAAFVLLLVMGSARAWASEIRGNVVRILDGDTVEILVDKQPIRIRLAAIDAPEKKQPFGTASRQSLANLVFRHDVTVNISGTDRYGRSIGTIYDHGSNVNATQVKLGMAWVYRKYSQDPALMQLENDARSQRLGLWSEANPVAPWEFRHGNKSRK